MTTSWDTRFRNHALWAVVDQIGATLQDIDNPNEVDARDSLGRVIWLMDVLQAHREVEDTRGYSLTMLDNVQRMLTGNVQNQLNQYAADVHAYAANLQTAGVQVDTVVDQMGSWPPLSPRGAAQAAGRAYATYVDKTNDALKAFSEQRDTLTEALTTLQQTMSTEEEAFVAARTDFEAKADERIKATLTELTSNYVGEVQEAVNTIESDQQAGQDMRQKLQEMVQQGNNILEAVANKAVAHDYRENARNKSIAGWVWDVAGLLVGGVPLVLLLVHFFKVDPNVESATSLTLTRLGVSVAAVGLATLCFHRGSVNHREARRSKRAHIRLSTAKPFIANQPEEFQKAILQGMADRIYLQGILDDEGAIPDASLFATALARVREQNAHAEDPE